MLSALRKNGERICLGDRWERGSLQRLREQESFSCPQCGEDVILKIGEKRIFHFSHVRDSQCQYDYERESDYHLNGKRQLYQWLKKLNLNPIMEFYDARIKQRADILFFIGERKFVLEYQCSSISDSTFRKRTRGYRSIGYIPIWILGANQFNKKKASLSTLTDFHYLFLQKSPSNVMFIPYYCSNSKRFIFQRSIQPISIRNVYSDQQAVNLEKMNIAQLFTPSIGKVINRNLWLKELKSWKQKQLRFQGSFQNPFLNVLYQNNLNLFLLPPYLGLPISCSPIMMTPPYVWQTYLFIDVFLKWDIEKPLRFHEIYVAFMNRISLKQIQLRQPPLMGEVHAIHFIQQYLQLLINTSILRRVDTNIYFLNQPVLIPTSISEQIEMEELFYKKYENILFK